MEEDIFEIFCFEAALFPSALHLMHFFANLLSHNLSHSKTEEHNLYKEKSRIFFGKVIIVVDSLFWYADSNQVQTCY